MIDEISEIINELKDKGNYRRLHNLQGNNYLNLSSNDYLSLAKEWKAFLSDFFYQFPDCGFSSSSSRLLLTDQEIYYKLESYLEKLYGKAALLFNSGYHANIGIISAISKMDSTLIICDKYVHASIIDGLSLSKVPFNRFPHNDIKALRKIIEKEQHDYKNLLIVAESVYSMTGDCAPLQELVNLKKEYKSISLYIDEAHAFGVFGNKGLGKTEEEGLTDHFDFIVGTFGKAAASQGAFLMSSVETKDFLINKARSLIYSTALPPVNIAWSLFMTMKLNKMNEERMYLKNISEIFKKGIEQISGKEIFSQSQIIPLETGNSIKAIETADKLLNKFNIIALPIRRPTVPPGKECIRFSLNTSFSLSDIQFILEAIKKSI